MQETPLYGASVAISEAVGVIGIACPDANPLLSFVSLFAPAVVRGNSVVIIPSQVLFFWGGVQKKSFTFFFQKKTNFRPTKENDFTILLYCTTDSLFLLLLFFVSHRNVNRTSHFAQLPCIKSSIVLMFLLE